MVREKFRLTLLRAKRFPVPFLIPSSFYSHLPAYEDGTDSVPKRRHIHSRRRGITQKKAYNIVKITLHCLLNSPVS